MHDGFLLSIDFVDSSSVSGVSRARLVPNHMKKHNAKPLEERLEASDGGSNFFLEISRGLFYL